MTAGLIFRIWLKYKINKRKLHLPLWSSFFIYKRTIPDRILNRCVQQVSKCVVVYVVHSETITFMYGIPLSIHFIVVVFEHSMLGDIKLSRVSS